MAATFQRDLPAAMVDELAAVLAAMFQVPASVTPSGPVSGRLWSVRVDVAGPATGWVTLGFAEEGAVAIAEREANAVGEPPPEAIAASLRRLCEQVAERVTARPIAQGARLIVVRVHEETHPPAGIDPAVYAVTVPALPVPVVIAIRCAVHPADEVPGDRLDVILDIDLPLVVRFGRTELPLAVLTRLGPGSVIDLGRAPDDPVDLLVSNRVVARGEVVVVGGNYGVRIVDVVSPAEWLRSMEVSV
jgi:flagellar motor switch protein FliN